MSDNKIAKLDMLIKATEGSLYKVKDSIGAFDFAEARAELAEASNSIDDAMHVIDILTAPDPTVWDDPHLP